MMYKKLFLLLFLFFFAGVFWFDSKNKNSDFFSRDVQGITSDRPIHAVTFFDQQTFYSGVEKARKDNNSFSYHVSGGIIPHHLFPGFIIADFFHRLSLQNPETIILIGPNHYERGEYEALSSLYGWQTPFGIVAPNDVVIKQLVDSRVVKIDERVLPEDHAVSGILPFVKYYIPNATVVPILLSGSMSQEDVKVLASAIKSHMSKDTVLIAPVDFSHYLTDKQAKEKDTTTLSVMKRFDYRQLFTLNNDYLDSPPSIALLLMVMQMIDTTDMDLLYHTNSGELQNDDYIETTSYFSIAYH